MRKLSGHVYFVLAVGTGLVKVGWSTDVSKRVSAVASELPYQIAVLAAIPCDDCQRVCTEIRESISPWEKLNGWFWLTEEVEKAIEAVDANRTPGIQFV